MAKPSNNINAPTLENEQKRVNDKQQLQVKV
jgi:hypothetical protein